MEKELRQSKELEVLSTERKNTKDCWQFKSDTFYEGSKTAISIYRANARFTISEFGSKDKLQRKAYRKLKAVFIEIGRLTLYLTDPAPSHKLNEIIVSMRFGKIKTLFVTFNKKCSKARFRDLWRIMPTLF